MAKKRAVGEKAPKKSDAPKYEDIRARLEEVVSQLERGEGTLEEAIAAYEEGVALVKAAHGMLDAAEKRLEVLRPRADGSFAAEEAGDMAGDMVSGHDGASAEEQGEGEGE